jgi:glucose-1-phosphate thymidylyltransferase
MRAILLCAGFATRLHPLTRDFPKPLLQVGGRPIVEDLVLQLAATGQVRAITVVSNARFYGKFLAWAETVSARLPELSIDILDDGAWDGMHRLGAVSDLEFAVARERPQGPVLVAAGDNIFRFPLGELLEDYVREPRNLVVVHREADPARLRRTGVAELGAEGRVQRLWEKPETPPTDLACPPLYVFRPGALERLRDFIVTEHDTDSPGHFVAWLAEHEPVFAHEMRGVRLDVGDVASYRSADAWLEEAERGRRDPGGN